MRGQPVGLAIEHADVRPVELVRAAAKEVAVHRPHVDELVRGVVHGVHEHERAGGVSKPGRTGHVGDRAQCVGRGADGEEPGAGGDRPGHVLGVEAAVRALHAAFELATADPVDTDPGAAASR